MSKTRRRLLLLPLALCFFLLSAPAARADMGPKPSLTLIVENPPEGEYYLDLLVDGDGQHQNLTGEKLDALDPEKLALLKEYDAGGLHAALASGTRVPLFGNVTGVKEGGAMVHRFSYHGVPEKFRVVIVTPDNQVLVSQAVEKTVFQQTMTMDYGTMEVDSSPRPDNRDYYGTNMQFHLQSPVLSYLLQFLSTCIPTLLIEGLLLLLFGYSFKKSGKPFLKINLLTQLLLTLVTALAGGLNAVVGMIVIVPAELAVTWIEAAYYTRRLTEKSRGRAAAYAVCANVLSAAAGYFIIVWEYFTWI